MHLPILVTKTQRNRKNFIAIVQIPEPGHNENTAELHELKETRQEEKREDWKQKCECGWSYSECVIIIINVHKMTVT